MKKAPLSTPPLAALAAFAALSHCAPGPTPPSAEAPRGGPLSAEAGPAGAVRFGPPSAVANFGDQQATGVAVASNGRVFVNFPRWGDSVRLSVAEVKGGVAFAFPDEATNQWAPDRPEAGEGHFVCVQSVVVDSADHLWALDPASPKFGGVVPGAAKLVEIDLATNTIVRTVRFGPEIAPPKSYLNDVRFDRGRHFAYLTDSGLGAVVVVDLATGAQRRILADHPSTKAEAGPLLAGGRPWLGPDGKTPQVHSDGIALDQSGAWLYWHALSGRSLYRAKTEDLRDASLSPRALGERVEKVTETRAADGIEFARDGGLYLTDIEENAVVRLDPNRPASQELVARGPELDWPDSLSFGPDGTLFVTASQISKSARFNQGVDRRTEPYRLFRLPRLGRLSKG